MEAAVVYIIGALVGCGIWAIRLEGKLIQQEVLNKRTQKDLDTLIVQTQKDIEFLTDKHQELKSEIVNKLGQLSESLARIEGRMGIERENAER